MPALLHVKIPRHRRKFCRLALKLARILQNNFRTIVISFSSADFDHVASKLPHIAHILQVI